MSAATTAAPRRRVPRAVARALKLGVATAMLLLLAAAAYTVALIGREQQDYQRGLQYNATWYVTQAGLEVARLRGAVAAAMVPGAGSDENEVALRLDIMDSRVSLLDTGDVAELAMSKPHLRAIVRQLRGVVAKVRAEFEGNAPGRLLRIHAMLGELHAPLARLAAAGHGENGIKAIAQQDALNRLYWILAALLCAAALAGAGLTAMLAWQNHLLSQAKDRARKQNRILQARDQELNTRAARFDAALTNMSQALCMVDGQGRLIVCNARFLSMFGLDPAGAEPGAPVADVFRKAAVAGRCGPALLEDVFARLARNGAAGVPSSFIQEDGDGVVLAMSQQPMAGGGWVATIEDVSERRRTEARIGFLASHDALTGLPNRRLFEARLHDALDPPAHPDGKAAVLSVNLDRFKQVNDTLGHAAGDALLKSVGARLQACVGAGGTVARVSGDEFAILQAAAPQPEAAEALARRILEALARPHPVDGHQVPSAASAGIAIAQPGDDPDLLMRRADIALSRAKADGRGRWRTYEDAMDAETQNRRAMAADLREALGRGEFEVFYQPLVNLQSGEVSAFEALLRWRHPGRGLVGPETFIPLAEELGFIVPIGRWVLAQACRDARAWPSHVRVAVNLSSLQVRDPGLVADVQRALDGAGLPAQRLELEITETVLLHDSDAVLGTLRHLTERGACIVLDDFGTGYSSLGYLRSFPFAKLKIDRSFIAGVAVREDCEAIVRSIAGLAHMLGMATTAEGVETADQLQALRAIGCTEAQGYLFDRPRPLGEVGRWFAGRTSARAMTAPVAD